MYNGRRYETKRCCATCKEWQVNLSIATYNKLPEKAFCCSFGNYMPKVKPYNICRWYAAGRLKESLPVIKDKEPKTTKSRKNLLKALLAAFIVTLSILFGNGARRKY
jgi:hypothetical protein